MKRHCEGGTPIQSEKQPPARQKTINFIRSNPAFFHAIADTIFAGFMISFFYFLIKFFA